MFWLAHVYARVLAGGLGGEPFAGRAILRVLAEEWPIIQAAGLPVLVLLLSAVGLPAEEAAATIAIAIGVASLFGWGVLLGRRRELPIIGTLLAGAVSTSFGLAIVALKLVVS